MPQQTPGVAKAALPWEEKRGAHPPSTRPEAVPLHLSGPYLWVPPLPLPNPDTAGGLPGVRGEDPGGERVSK